MKLLLLTLFINISLFASDILTNYRINGIDAIEKEMDLALTKEEYWSNHIKDKDTTFGYIESYLNVLTCNKEKSTLNLYSLDEKNKFEFKKEYGAFTGKKKGDKVKEGDFKTPIGIYQITQKLSKDTNLNSFYGPLAFVTSYPNIYDLYRGKNGSGIWIHGLPIEQERDDFTRGCIAINNSNIECLDRNIDISKTLLIIDSSEVQKNVSKELLASILSQLYKWRFAWLYNDIDAYLNFYAPEFVRYDGMDIEKFTKYKTRIFKKTEKKIIIFKNINIVKYPNSSDIFEITFKEIYKSNTFEFIGNKTLIVKVDEKKKINILTEK
ncbi:MAG: L,D-transpeptidase family protein [Sulfurimonas sp.]|uniref:L,D-transpeptidase family protein n=1 Tax=Sulfurimonas sp. TaxID=2022749 RepID=UPI002609A61F|nr:L,D-transpeptidase family protein [Sulfurimonas sp.]MCW8894265.1 L,D-transpeptidase family protein [Sulfurimonas sp.]MCW8953994.1 L,D-transpeptidase family protein [Sulfurimonas sp.]MCW9067657.1 L,D-transpeptidase family protein [Sulfurimonas sp.]